MSLLPENIKTARLAAGLSQRQLAIKVGVGDVASVSRWELGKQEPRGKTLTRLAEVLEKSVDWFHQDHSEAVSPGPVTAGSAEEVREQAIAYLIAKLYQGYQGPPLPPEEVQAVLRLVSRSFTATNPNSPASLMFLSCSQKSENVPHSGLLHPRVGRRVNSPLNQVARAS